MSTNTVCQHIYSHFHVFPHVQGLCGPALVRLDDFGARDVLPSAVIP